MAFDEKITQKSTDSVAGREHTGGVLGERKQVGVLDDTKRIASGGE